MLIVQLYENLGGVTNPAALTLDESLEEGERGGEDHDDEEQRFVSESSPSIRQVSDV
jgi:hypothetical protein